MSNYVKSVDFSVKDALPTGDPAKKTRGSEVDTEFNNIATAIATKSEASAAMQPVIDAATIEEARVLLGIDNATSTFTARVATHDSKTFSGTALNVIDGVSLAIDDRILVKMQNSPSENGIYMVTVVGTGANGTWVRASEADSSSELSDGMLVSVREGFSYADSVWMLDATGPIVLDTTALSFIQVAAKSLLLNTNSWNRAQSGAIKIPAFSSNIALDFSEGNHFSFTATSNFTLARPINVTPGQSGTIEIVQDATGSRIISWGSGWLAIDGVKPVLSTLPVQRDLLTYFVFYDLSILINIIGPIG